MTNAECRWLRRSGQFSINREGAKLAPDRVVPAAAWFYAFILAYSFGSSLLIINFSGAASWKQSQGSLTLVGLWFWVHVGHRQALLGALALGEKKRRSESLYSDTQLRRPSGASKSGAIQ